MSEFMDSRKGGREKSKGSLSASKMKERQKGNVCMANLLPVPPTCIGKRENLLLERERERLRGGESNWTVNEGGGRKRRRDEISQFRRFPLLVSSDIQEEGSAVLCDITDIASSASALPFSELLTVNYCRLRLRSRRRRGGKKKEHHLPFPII